MLLLHLCVVTANTSKISQILHKQSLKITLSHLVCNATVIPSLWTSLVNVMITELVSACFKSLEFFLFSESQTSY